MSAFLYDNLGRGVKTMSGRFKPFETTSEDGVHRLVILGRKSKDNPGNENASIDASIADAEAAITSNHSGPMSILRLGEQISGMVADRETIRQTEDLMMSRQVDTVATEDLGRLFRNPRHMWAFVQDCVDAGVRFIAVHDMLDTANDDWETAMALAVARHGFVVSDTKRREKRSAIHAFHGGGSVMKVKFTYRKLSREGARSGLFGPPNLRIAKLSEWTETILLFTQWVLSETPVYSWDDMADLANTRGIPVGPYAAEGRWTGALMNSLMSDRILGGYRSFRKTTSRQIYRTGLRETNRNPKAVEWSYHPELAHLSPEQFEQLEAALARRFVPRSDRGRKHKRFKVPTKASRFPAQHAVCSACNDIYYAYDRDCTKCSNSGKGSAKRCWNHVQLNMAEARKYVLPWVLTELDKLPNFREQLIEQCWGLVQQMRSGSHDQIGSTERVIAKLEARAANYAKAIGKGVLLDAVLAEAEEVQQQVTKARKQLAALQAAAKNCTRFSRREDVAADLLEAMHELAEKSYEFGAFLKRLLTRFVVVPVVAVGTTLVRPRAHLTLEVSRPASQEAESRMHRAEAVINLFNPAEPIRQLEACIKAKAANPNASLHDIGFELKIGHMTVKRSLDLAKQMQELGLADPYRELTEPPENASRWRHTS